ncbi:NADH-quinone oxidoreductase subunit M [Photobacterium proteolyticum]|uniref:NADH-quinone oxidoreductase subunit M n=1 Tax=Photobacterium proteolyticum TaxID=1903952 RepID=A0A1Q9GCZ0_9GAMM|nr:NADH-quinone oxidoreductase subunit M [Photobacterium proteolyticum]OLQ72251.1 NADH-quinone oxidoreductase subunit M [Photobacterium proteolyticum]
MNLPLLSLLIALPLVGSLLLVTLPGPVLTRWLALGIATCELLLAAWLLWAFDSSSHQIQFLETHAWIPALNIRYKLGIDGFSILFIFLTALVGWVCVVASWRAIQHRVRQFMASLLVMQALMLGVFCALDLFLFYIFWEAMLIPMYLIIGVWGGDNRFYATLKFFLYTLAGSVFFLVGIIVLYLAGGNSFDIQYLAQQSFSLELQRWIFIAFFIGFAVKVPMFPFHTWLPDAHVEAPTAGSIILAGVLLKMGAYGFIRFSLPILPDASLFFAPVMATLSVIAIIYGGFLALAQDDLKKLVAYSSISHMGFVTLGLFTFNSQGIKGAILQMFNHGIVTSALFLMVGLIYERTHSRSIGDYGGLMKALPVYTVFFAIFVLASMALPGTNSFIGELFVLAGAFGSMPVYGGLAIIGAALSAVYLLSMYKRVALGPLKNPKLETLNDINLREFTAIAALLFFVFWIGLHPLPFLALMDASVDDLLRQIAPQTHTDLSSSVLATPYLNDLRGG